MLRVRFAPSPTGYLHIGSARTFIFNWLYARHNQGVMILRIDDTDVERNTQASLDSIFDGLKWLDLGWDEFYRQSERLDLHRKLANEILAKGLAYRDFTPLAVETEEKDHTEGHWIVSSRHARTLAGRERPPRRRRRAVRGALRVPRESREEVTFTDLVYGEQSKATADIEDFALLRSNGAADVSHGLLRRRRRSAHQPHHPRPGSPDQHLQARADLRGAGRRSRRSSRICRC